jgi:hypothetical protein
MIYCIQKLRFENACKSALAGKLPVENSPYVSSRSTFREYDMGNSTVGLRVPVVYHQALLLLLLLLFSSALKGESAIDSFLQSVESRRRKLPLPLSHGANYQVTGNPITNTITNVHITHTVHQSASLSWIAI